MINRLKGIQNRHVTVLLSEKINAVNIMCAVTGENVTILGYYINDRYDEMEKDFSEYFSYQDALNHFKPGNTCISPTVEK